VSSSTASQIINIGSVSSSIVDPNLLDNNDTDPIIVNHLPTADSKILSSVSNQNQLELPDGTLSGDPQDILDTIINYQIFSLPDPICATLYLGDPLNGGTLVSAGQTLTPLQANNLYILPLQTCSQTVSFEYLTQDSFLAWSQEPAQIRISFSSIITTGTTIDISRPIVRPIVVVPQTVTNNPTQVLTIEPTTESKTQSLPQVLGASEKTVDQPDQNLIRTGSPVENNGWFQQDTLLLSELVISSIFLIYSIQIRREEKVLD
jgi:hypothetical protein